MANKSLRVYLKAYFVVYNQLNSKINLTLWSFFKPRWCWSFFIVWNWIEFSSFFLYPQDLWEKSGFFSFNKTLQSIQFKQTNLTMQERGRQ